MDPPVEFIRIGAEKLDILIVVVRRGKMKTLKQVSILLIAFTLIIGCSGNTANIKNQSEDESKVTQKKITNDWSDYDIKYNRVVIVFDPKKDDKKILVGNYWGTVKDQETWTRLVNNSERVSSGYNLVWGNPIREIWVQNQFYGYVSHRQRELVSAEIVNENTVRLIHTYSGDWRN
jgi:hypothetical protein